VRRAQRQGVYERLPELRLVTQVTRGLNPKVHWVDRNGVAGQDLLITIRMQPLPDRLLKVTIAA
jgi:hypothetical protein